uniref:C3H1-type domain-containing protein n=1 Tax=Chenopodium quinoa TaxID=63459 RepID=A0A803LFT4_CHEQI
MDGRKRGRNNDAGAVHSNGGFKKHKQETDGIGSKSKPCTKFFSTSGCPFGENCHFLHHVSGGYNAVAQLMNLPPMSRNAPPPPPPPQSHNGSAPAAKTRLCNKFNSAEGCKYGDKCHFAHATAKISVDASLAGAIIGKSGVNSKQICRQTGVKLSIRDHDSDSNKRNIELEGTFDQIKMASEMVHDLVASVSANAPFNKAPVGPAPHGPTSTNYRTKLCENFTKGSCTFGDRCHFAHGAAELRKSGV